MQRIGMLDAGFWILEKSFTAENAEVAENLLDRIDTDYHGFVRYEKAQNAQKGQKNGQKSAL